MRFRAQLSRHATSGVNPLSADNSALQDTFLSHTWDCPLNIRNTWVFLILPWAERRDGQIRPAAGIKKSPSTLGLHSIHRRLFHPCAKHGILTNSCALKRLFWVEVSLSDFCHVTDVVTKCYKKCYKQKPSIYAPLNQFATCYRSSLKVILSFRELPQPS